MLVDPDNPTPRSANPSRRAFLKRAALGTVAGGLASLGYAYSIEPHWVEVVLRDLPIAGLPSSLDGRRLIQISDLHVGDLVDFDYLSRCLASTSALHPDIVVVTGDFMSCHTTEQVDQVERLFAAFKQPPLGVFGITGNHDFGHHWRDVRTADVLESRLTNGGVLLLRNSAQDVAGLHLVGVEDSWSPQFDGDATRALTAAAAKKPSLVLCHNPDVCDWDVWSGYRGWILSGHTHGGQCKPPFLPPPLLPVKNKRYTAGEFALEGGRKLYINRGLGYIKRVRFNARPEITLFRLVSEPVT